MPTWDFSELIPTALCKAEMHLANYSKIGHYNLWLIDKLQVPVEKNHEVLLFSNWVNTINFNNMDQSFITVALHSDKLRDDLNVNASKISTEAKEGLPSDFKFLCEQMKILLPFLPLIEEVLTFQPNNFKYTPDVFNADEIGLR